MPTKLSIDHNAALHSLLLSLALKQAISDDVLTEALELLKRPLTQFSIGDYKRSQLLDDLLAGAISAEGFMRAWQHSKINNQSKPPAYLPIERHAKTTPGSGMSAIIVGIIIVLAALAGAAYWASQQKQFAKIASLEKAAATSADRLSKTHFAQQYVMEGISLANMAKTNVAEYYISMGKYPDSNTELGLPAPTDIRGDGTDSVAVSEGGVITIQFNQRVGENQTLVITPSSSGGGPIAWDCKGGTLLTEYRPPHCQ